MRLLLFSNSTNAGEEYLNYTLPYIDKFLLKDKRTAVFIPYAGISVGFDAYTKMVGEKLAKVGVSLTSIHETKDKIHAIKETSVIIIGGGNTFYLLKKLQDENLLAVISDKVRAGAPYIGWSAGANMACPTICTTNDMPIVEPDGFKALNLIPFQINPHYTDFVQQDHAGETREMRIKEFILANRDMFVAGLREGTLLNIEESAIELKGMRDCRIFKYGNEAIEVSPGGGINFLLS